MRHITFRLQEGQLLKEEIEKVVKEKSIKAGCIISAVGGLKHSVLRMAGAEPDSHVTRESDDLSEIVSITGTLSIDGCHIHISLSDGEGKVFGGHLKDGCVIYKTAEIVLLIFDDVEYKRVSDEKTGFGELTVEHL